MKNYEKYLLIREDGRYYMIPEDVFIDLISKDLSINQKGTLVEHLICDCIGLDHDPSDSSHDIPSGLTRSGKWIGKGESKYSSKHNFSMLQVKPKEYEYILYNYLHLDHTDWFLIKTKDISSKPGKENKEEGKMPLSRQHRGHETEGQVCLDINTKKFIKNKTVFFKKSGKDKFSDFATYVGRTSPIKWDQKDLGQNENDKKQIASYVRYL
jgi:hypothetical protein